MSDMIKLVDENLEEVNAELNSKCGKQVSEGIQNNIDDLVNSVLEEKSDE